MIKSRHNFTLIEVLVAMLLLGLLMLGLFLASGGITTSWQKVSKSNQKFYELVQIEKVLDNSLPNIVPFIWRDAEIPTDRIACFTGEQDAISFTCLHKPNNLSDGAIRFMAIILEEDELVAYYKNRPYIDLEELASEYDAGKVERTVLAVNVEEIRFSYANAEEDADEEEIVWEDIWDNDDEERFDVPLAVRIDITWEPESGEDTGFTETFLYRTAGNSQFQRWGDWKYYESLGNETIDDPKE